MKRILTFLFLISNLSAFAQDIKFPIDEVKFMELVGVKKDPTIYFFLGSYFARYHIRTGKFEDSLKYLNDVPKQKKLLDKLGEWNVFEPVVNKDSIYFVQNEGGLVYKFDNGLITRIDHSFEHKMQVNSSIFSYNGTIYRYGGYGYFTCRNFFTYFDSKTHEWEALAPIKSKNQPEGTSHNQFYLKGNEIYLFGGNYQNPQNLVESLHYKKVWKFNFSERSWTYLGDINNPDLVLSLGRNIGDYIYLEKENEVLNVSAESNKIVHYTKSSTNLIIGLAQFVVPFEGRYFCLINDASLKQSHLSILSKDELLGKPVSESPLYDTDHTSTIVLILIASILLTFLGFVLYKRIDAKVKTYRLIDLDNDCVIFKNKILYLESNEIQLIKSLLAHPAGLEGNDLLSFIEKKGIDHSYLLKHLSAILEKINVKLKSFTGHGDNIIFSGKSPIDSRVKIYKIRQELFKPERKE